jgi:peptidoglycan hydrolase-like protein with peptidoglycan-binding domain
MTDAEPPLTPGDTGETVLRLQTRLQALGLFDGALDGAFGEATKAAVTQLQEHHGVHVSGDVGDETWAALARAEQSAGVHNPFAKPAGGPSADSSATPVGALSEDQQWRWDGEGWQPNEDRVGAVDKHADHGGGGQVSADGQWLWDGNQWQPTK